MLEAVRFLLLGGLGALVLGEVGNRIDAANQRRERERHRERPRR